MTDIDPAPQLKRRGPRIKGITRDSVALGCSRQHLYAVIRCHRVSQRLLTRYHALKAVSQPAPVSVPTSSTPPNLQGVSQAEAPQSATNQNPV